LVVHGDSEKCREKRVFKSREDMPMQGLREMEVILAGAVIEVGIVDVGGE
jgi:hypothetical protein